MSGTSVFEVMVHYFNGNTLPAYSSNNSVKHDMWTLFSYQMPIAYRFRNDGHEDLYVLVGGTMAPTPTTKKHMTQARNAAIECDVRFAVMEAALYLPKRHSKPPFINGVATRVMNSLTATAAQHRLDANKTRTFKDEIMLLDWARDCDKMVQAIRAMYDLENVK